MTKEVLKQTIEELIDNMINKGEYCKSVVTDSTPTNYNVLSVGFYFKTNIFGTIKQICYYFNPPTEEDKQYTQQVIEDYIIKLTLKGSKSIKKYLNKCYRTQFNYGVDDYVKEEKITRQKAIERFDELLDKLTNKN